MNDPHREAAPEAAGPLREPSRPAWFNADTGQWEEFEDDAWLDDYEQGTTTEAFIHRMKNGMPKRYPQEFKDDVVRVARTPDVSLESIAADFGISVTTLKRWMAQADIDIHAGDPEFGYRFIADELEATGETCSENRVHRLCRDHNIWSTTTTKGRKGAGKTPGPAVHDDLVQRDFVADDIDAVWLTDITEHPTGEGKLYLCAFKDLCSNRIVGYSMSDRMTAQLATTALRTAVARRSPANIVIIHPDRGSQFRARDFCRGARRRRPGRLDGPRGLGR